MTEYWLLVISDSESFTMEEARNAFLEMIEELAGDKNEAEKTIAVMDLLQEHRPELAAEIGLMMGIGIAA